MWANRKASMLLKRLFDLLDMKVSAYTIDELISSPTITFESIRVLLQYLNIKAMLVKLPIVQLVNIPLPAISKTPNRGFIILTKVSKGGTVSFIQKADKKEINLPFQSFEQEWDGKLLLMEKTVNSKDKHYAQNERKRSFDTTLRRIAFVMLFLLLAVSVYSLSTSIPLLLLLLAKAGGLFFSILLLQKEIGMENKLTQLLCRVDEQNENHCDKVLASPYARLFQLVSLTELSLIYFSGGLLACLLLGVASQSAFIPLLLVALTIGVIPLTIGSIIYQKLINAWCTLCLMISALLWFELLIILLNWKAVTFAATEVLPISIAFILPLTIWIAVRKGLIDQKKAKQYKRELVSLKRDKPLFNLILKASSELTFPDGNGGEVLLGNKASKNKITAVFHDNCQYCPVVFEELRNLISLNTDLSLSVRINLGDKKAEPTILNAVYSKYLQMQEADFLAFLSSFLSEEYLSITDDSGSEALLEVQQMIAQNQVFFSKNKFTEYPSVFMNNMKIPLFNFYEVTDVKLLLAS